MPKLQAITIMIAGDLAFSGKMCEYEALLPALSALKDNAAAAASCPVKMIATPGNHDCDFSKDDAVRKLIINSIPSNNQHLSDQSIVNQCVKVQEHFWHFLDHPLFERPSVNNDRIYTEYIINADQRQLRFRCYNTAWVSQQNEAPGVMALPRKYFQGHELEGRKDLTITTLHHPTHWLTPNRKREFDLIIDQASDFILFGHEHLPEEYTKSDFDGHKTGYLFGGAFQTSPSECPGCFNVIVVDLDNNLYQVRKYKRRAENFIQDSGEIAWEKLGRSQADSINGVRMKESFAAFLEDPQVEFAHRSGRRLRLDDIFITPDFTQSSPDILHTQRGDGKILRGEKFDDKLRTAKKLLILGQERSGRTTLAKKCFWTLYRSGIVPVYVDGSNINVDTVKDATKLLYECLSICYVNADKHAFDQMAPSHRAIIIDGFEKSKLSATGRSLFIEAIKSKFAHVIVFGDPLMLLAEVADGVMLEQALPDFLRLEVRELGRTTRRRLITRWHSIGGLVDISTLRMKVTESERIINTLLGKSFLPANPIFVLSFLQSIETSRPMDNIGSYGFHYESFITNALARNVSVSLDIQYRFLSEVAYHLFSNQQDGLETAEFDTFFEGYCVKYGIHPDKNSLLQGFWDSRMLECYDEIIRFKYPYAYYFFVARYFRDHIEDQSVREQIRLLCGAFHVEKNANIWMFLAHLSKSNFLLEVITEKAASVFSAHNSIKLEGDVDFLRDMAKVVPPITLPSTSPEDNITKHYEHLDNLDEAERQAAVENADPDKDVFMQLDAMVRTLQILGQLLKNFPGSLTATEKLSIVENGFHLGLRGIGFILDAFEAGKDDLVEFISSRVAQRYGGEPTDEIFKQRLRGAIFWLVNMNTFGMIKLISHALGAKGEDTTYTNAVKKIGTNAAKLIEVSVTLDTLKIPKRKILKLNEELKDDFLCRHLLASLVARHLYLFEVPNNVKDELCQKLDIGVQGVDKKDALKELIKRA